MKPVNVKERLHKKLFKIKFEHGIDMKDMANAMLKHCFDNPEVLEKLIEELKSSNNH